MPLTALPMELIEQITLNLDLETFRNTRLTCSLLQHQSVHSFRDLFFLSKTISWTREDLDTLVSITTHPELGSAFQSLIIDATPRHSISLWQLDLRIQEEQRNSADKTASARLKQQYVDLEKQARSAATFFNETLYDHKRLRTVFELLKQQGTLRSLIFKYEGIATVSHRPLREYCRFVQLEMSRPFVSAISALAASGICLDTISLHNSHAHGAVSTGRLETLAPSLRHLDTTFSQLTTLQLCVRDWRHPQPGFETDVRPPFLARFLAKARSLRHLSLSGHSCFETDLFGALAAHCRLPNLQSCDLAAFQIHAAADLLAFLASSADTLKSLSLRYVSLADLTMPWPALLARIASDDSLLPALHTLHIVHVYAGVQARVKFGAGGSFRVRLGSAGEGAEWRGALAEVLRGVGMDDRGPGWGDVVALYGFVDV